MKNLSYGQIKRQIEQIEQVGYLQNCWVEAYKPGGTAKGDKHYYHLRSKQPLSHGKKSKHLKAGEVAHYQMLVANGRLLRKLKTQLTRVTAKISGSRAALTSSASNEWYTPPEYIALARQVLGGIDLDPASSAKAQGWVQAQRYYTHVDNGLLQPWQGRVWLNPPYGSHTSLWLDKLQQHYEGGEVPAAVILVKPAVGTKWYQNLAARYPQCQPHNRIRFIDASGVAQSSPVHGNSFFYLGPEIDQFHQTFATIGTISVPYGK